MHRIGCLPMFALYLAIGVGVISVGLNGLISIPLDQNGDYAFISPYQEKLEDQGHFLYLAAPDGSSLMPLRTEVPVPVTLGGRWSPDGKRLLYIVPSDPTDLNNGGALFVTDDPQTPGQKILDVPAMILSPSFSPNGEKIAYIQVQKNNSESNPPLLHVVEVREGADSRLLLQAVVPYGPQLQWSPDGKELLAIMVQTPSDEATPPSTAESLLQAEIVRVGVITGTQTPVTKIFIGESETMGSIWPSLIWAPDGTIIFNGFDPEYLYSKEQIPPLLLYAWSLQEQRKARLTGAPGPTEIPALYMLPTLSPSGNKLAYLKVWEDGEIGGGEFLSFRLPGTPVFLSEIYVMDLASGEQQKVAGPSALFQPFWIDETHLGYVEFAGNVATVWIQDLEKRTRRNLSSDLKTRLWEQRLREACVQPQESKEVEALVAELEKLRAETQMLKQRLEDQEHEIASLQRQVEAQRTSLPRVEIILAISIALLLLWHMFF